MSRTRKAPLVTAFVLIIVATLFGCSLLLRDGAEQNGWYIKLNINHPTAAKAITVSEYDVTGLAIEVYDPDGVLIEEISWQVVEGQQSYLIPVSEQGQHKIVVTHISDNNGEIVEAEESALFNIQATVITVIDIIPGCIGLIDVNPGDDETSVLVDFDQILPDTTFSRDGALLEVVYDPTINNTWMGRMTLPAEGTDRFGSFVIYYGGKLGNTITSYRTYVPSTPGYEWRTPYVAYAVTVNDDSQEEAYVVGRTIVGSDTPPLPEEECPVDIWLDCRLEADTLVHVAGFRENLGDNFVTWNYGKLSDLVKTPLTDGRSWGDLDIVFVEICTGMWGEGPPFLAYVDDISVSPSPFQ